MEFFFIVRVFLVFPYPCVSSAPLSVSLLALAWSSFVVLLLALSSAHQAYLAAVSSSPLPVYTMPFHQLLLLFCLCFMITNLSLCLRGSPLTRQSSCLSVFLPATHSLQPEEFMIMTLLQYLQKV